MWITEEALGAYTPDALCLLPAIRLEFADGSSDIRHYETDALAEEEFREACGRARERGFCEITLVQLWLHGKCVAAQRFAD